MILDGDGDRLLAKYYDGRSKAEQAKNEGMLYKKTKAVAAKQEGNNSYIISIIIDTNV